eukprot:767177-Hanusia_phi.AAC.6
MEELDDVIALDETRYGELARNPRTLRLPTRSLLLPFPAPSFSLPAHLDNSLSSSPLHQVPSVLRSLATRRIPSFRVQRVGGATACAHAGAGPS